MKFEPYMKFLRGIGEILNREIKPSLLAVELYRIDATCEEAATEYGDQL